MRGFPSRIDSTKKLSELIIEILWTNIIHTSCNYAMPPVFTPTQAIKTYSAVKGPTCPDKMFVNGFFAAVSRRVSLFYIQLVIKDGVEIQNNHNSTF